MRDLINSRWFALSEILLVLISGITLYSWPEVGGWALILPLLPWCVRFVSGQLHFQRALFDWFVLIFVITAAVGYWAAYDRIAAAHKFWLILLAVLLYYALSHQPKENLGWISGIFFSIGVGVSIYFFLTHDFVALPRKLQIVNSFGRWMMQVRPQVPWKPIHPNYVAGVAAITAPFGFYPLWKTKKQAAKNSSAISNVIVLSYMLITFTIFMATSRGVILAILSAAGTWILWKVVSSTKINSPLPQNSIFPLLVLLYLGGVILFLYIGPASFTGSVITQNDYGSGTRAELFVRSLYFLKEFPFTGGGLSAFPGLYSYYILDIPIFYLPNSHNLFLDVGIEQGIFAGLSYLLLFLVSVWLVARSIIEASSVEIRVFSWLVLFALIISIVHGMVDDYLYNGNGALLSLFLMGTSSMIRRESVQNEGSLAWFDSRIPALVVIILVAMGLLNFNRIRSAWYADLGAVQMGRVELAGFPTDQWTESTIVPQLEPAEISLHSSLRYDPSNPTANYRLGMISMLRQDFKTALVNLEIAHDQQAGHRGIAKNLGYCYAWLGEMGKAKALLQQIPEAHHELSNYAWWWSLHGRDDLAKNASQLASQLNSQREQP